MQFNIPPMHSYFDAVDENCSISKEQPPMMMPLLLMTDDLFREDVFLAGSEMNPFAMNLAMNAYTMFLAAVRQALSGHPVAVYPLARTIVEAACYAYLIGNDETLGEVWLSRHRDKDSAAQSRKRFGRAVSEVAQRFEKDQPHTAALITELYQSHIDLGAHPNPRAILPYLARGEETDELMALNLGSVYAANGLMVNQGLLVCCETAIISAFIILNAFKAHPKPLEDIQRFQALDELKEKLLLELKASQLPN